MKKFIMGTLIAAVVITFAGGMIVANAEEGANLNGTAYIAGHGGHLAILDLATMRPPTEEKDRIVITDAGGELEGITAGMSLDAGHKNPGGGSHGSALVGKTLVVGLL